ncbi:MAG: outer membrane protein assembly factor BamA [Gemmatimonadetes bacterium]|nr:outer membrane protein assembly factor BamA [Gemmatimonadota bacterium]
MRALRLAWLLTLLGAGATAGRAQIRPDETTVLDSIAVLGNTRVPTSSVLAIAGIPTGKPVSYRDLQRGLQALYATGQYQDIRVLQGTVAGREVLQIELLEHPLLSGWSVRGAEKISEGTVRDRIKMIPLRPYDPAAVERARASIDSLYRKRGYYLASVQVRTVDQPDGSVRTVFEIDEGRRVAISQILINGNRRYAAEQIVDRMKTGAEGFFWFQKGEYQEDDVDSDIREQLPGFYGQHGMVDFRVVRDSLIVAEGTGKATLVLDVEEGPEYRVGSFEIVGNRQVPTAQLQLYYPFADTSGGGFLGLGGRSGPLLFNEKQWDDATQNVRTLYYNQGYIYADVRPVLTRRIAADSQAVLDLRWQIIEGTPAIVNKVAIKGNTITHEDVIRRAIVMVPGDVFRQQALIQSYQNVSNLGFFEQPAPPPTYEQANEQGDVNVVFEVKERRTGNVNFGASLGQGTGVGGFIGLDESNLFGRAKRLALQWQFGQNINDFNVSYTDPALWGSLTSGTLSLHSSRLRYTIADLGRYRTRGGSLQLGFPLLGSRYTRIYPSYTLEQNQLESETLSSSFYCRNCVLSAVGLNLVRDTRVGLPFATGGVMHQAQLTQAGGALGGSGNFRRANFEGRWYVPLAELGGSSPTSSPLTLLLGFTAKSGFVWGDVGPHFRQLFSLGGTQFGIPLRGYDEFSITPQGFDPNARTFSAGANAFGRAYFAGTTELGFRVSQALYANIFADAGNLWATPAQFNPTRLFRGAGIGVSVISPLGPLGLDYAYGFDRTDAAGNPKPGWKFHFKLGNFF